MDEKLYAKCAAQAEVLRALGHPSRLYIVFQLANGSQKCVCELAAALGADMSTVSRHLSVLKRVGILEEQKRGQMIFHKLRTPCVVELLECIGRTIEQSLEAKLSSLR